MKLGSLSMYVGDASSLARGTSKYVLGEMKKYAQKFSDKVNVGKKFDRALLEHAYKTAALAGSGYVGTELASSQLDKVQVFADRRLDGSYFCSPEKTDVEKEGFVELASNYIYTVKSGTPEQIGDSILGKKYDGGLDEIGKMIGCLDRAKIDFKDVYEFDSDLWRGIEYASEKDPEKFAQVAPYFAKNVFGMKTSVPEEIPNGPVIPPEGADGYVDGIGKEIIDVAANSTDVPEFGSADVSGLVFKIAIGATIIGSSYMAWLYNKNKGFGLPRY